MVSRRNEFAASINRGDSITKDQDQLGGGDLICPGQTWLTKGSDVLDRCLSFLEEIGLQICQTDEIFDGFVPGVRISHGKLVVASDCGPSNLLHEAGHLAIIPGRWRLLLDGDIACGIGHILDEWFALGLGPDDPLSRAVMQTSDPEATAWAWAAGRHLGLGPKDVIPDADYGGDGVAVRAQLTCCTPRRGRVTGYLGVHGLAHAGMTALHDRGPLLIYPQMGRWLQIE